MSRYSSIRARLTSPLGVDSLIALGIFALGVQQRATDTELIGDLYRSTPDTFNLLLIALQTLPLALRRRFPQTVLVVVLAAFALDRAFDYPGTLASVGMVLAFHALGSELPPRRSLVLGSALVVSITMFTAIGAVELESVTAGNVISTCLIVAVPLVLGREVYRRQRRMEALEDRAEQAEREREERARQAVAEERARIARELHDVVAHQMAVMTLQAEGARRLTGGSDARVAAALDTIRQTGHDALTEMRRMVGLLRDPGGPEGAGDPALSPQPGLADLDHLVTQMREAGLEVTLERTGTERPLPNGLDLSAFRIVQESLTNALKHGGRDVAAKVSIAYGDDRLDLRIIDDGRGSETGGGGNGSGQGIVGMRERVAVLQGELTATRLPSGGFLVHASLPIDS